MNEYMGLSQNTPPTPQRGLLKRGLLKISPPPGDLGGVELRLIQFKITKKEREWISH